MSAYLMCVYIALNLEGLQDFDYDEVGISVASAGRPPLRLHPITTPHATRRRPHLSNECRCCPCIVLEVGLDDLLGLVVPRKTVDTTLNENETELGVLVFAVDFKVFANRDGFFDEVVEVFWDRGCKSCSLK